MARPIKQGLDYYPLDVGFLQDVKIRRIMRACGIQSIPVLISLLANIYRNDGYFLRWSPDMSFLIADELGVSEGAVTATVDKAVQVDFFNANMYECYGVLTSEGIQSRFFEAASRRREVRYDARFLLINVNVYKNLVNVDNNPVNVDDNPQSKVKESKVKESKVKERKEEGEERTSAAADEIMGYYSSNIHPVSSLVERDKLIALVETHGDAFVHKAIERAVVRNKRSLAYITGILNRWEANGYDEGISENHKSSRNQWQHSEDYERFMREREEHKRKLRQRGS
jgi:DnaD/phage-associated family protein